MNGTRLLWNVHHEPKSKVNTIRGNDGAVDLRALPDSPRGAPWQAARDVAAITAGIFFKK